MTLSHRIFLVSARSPCCWPQCSALMARMVLRALCRQMRGARIKRRCNINLFMGWFDRNGSSRASLSVLKADRGVELAAADRDYSILRQHLCDFFRRAGVPRRARALWRKRLHARLAGAGLRRVARLSINLFTKIEHKPVRLGEAEIAMTPGLIFQLLSNGKALCTSTGIGVIGVVDLDHHEGALRRPRVEHVGGFPPDGRASTSINPAPAAKTLLRSSVLRSQSLISGSSSRRDRMRLSHHIGM